MSKNIKLSKLLQRKYYVIQLGILGLLSLYFLSSCKEQPSGPMAMRPVRTEGFSSNRAGSDTAVPEKKHTARAKEKQQPQNPYTPERMIHPVAYGTVPAEYKPVVVPQE